MVIQFRGTDTNENKAAHMTAVMSAMSASKKSRKTLVLQFNQKSSIEDLLIGKKNAEVDIHDIGFIYEDTGMDAILMRIGAIKVQKEHFDACFSPIMDKENMLDIAGASGRDDFESSILEEEEKIETLLIQAKEVYDDIFIYSNATNPELLEVLNKYSDVVIVCIRQGSIEKISAAPDNSIYLVTNYDKDSIYSVRSLKKTYKADKMYAIPYCCEFKDAYNNANIFGYLAKNEKISEDDVNYNFISSIRNVLDQFLEDKEEQVKQDEKLPETEEDDEVDEEELSEFTEPPVEVIEQKKAFKKKKKVVVEKTEPENEEIEDIDDDDDVDETDDDIEYIDEPVPTIVKETKPVKKSRKELREEKKMRKKSAVKEAVEILAEEENWTCPSCGENNPAKAKFCMECGTTKPVIPTEWVCPKCGEINPPKAKFCMECGATKA